MEQSIRDLGLEEKRQAAEAVTQEPDEGSELPAPPTETPLPTWRRLLTAKTGPGPLEKYQDHPLCWDRSLGLAQVIRGGTGLYGALDLAVVDLVMGLFRWWRERRAPATPAP